MKMSDNEKKSYGLKLREYREKLNLTQEEVVNKAKKFIEETYRNDDSGTTKICFNQNQLSNWENGKYIPHHINRFLLSVIYDVPVDELEFNYPQNENEDLLRYISDLVKEDETYIDKDNMTFESEDELKEIIGNSHNSESKDAFKNGTQINIHYLTKLHLNQNWNIQKKIQYIIDLHIAQGLIVPQYLMDILNETDPEKKSQMYYEYYVNFYNGSLYASKKRKNLNK